MRISPVTLFFVIAGFVFSCTRAAKDNDPGLVPRSPAEKTAPSFELADLDGQNYRLADYIDSIPIMVWFTNLCAGCQKAIPHLDAVYKGEIQLDAELLAVSLLGEDSETARKISKKLNPGFPILLDPEGMACKDFVGEYVPATCPLTNLFIIDRQGIIRYEGHYPGLGVTEAMSLLMELTEHNGDD